MSLEWLALAFFATALIYSSVGFGGGSTYNALLILAGLSFVQIPIVSLSCNIFVVAIGAVRFWRAGALDFRRFWPLAILSIPGAWLGGVLKMPPLVFMGILALALLVAGLLMVCPPFWKDRIPAPQAASRSADVITGAGLGVLAGITGIGGGIYLSPILHLRRWGEARLIAGVCALFILVNSIGGLFGHFSKLGSDQLLAILGVHWPLFPAVILGGIVGSTLGSRTLKETHLRLVTGILILYVAARLGLQFKAEIAA